MLFLKQTMQVGELCLEKIKLNKFILYLILFFLIFSITSVCSANNGLNKIQKYFNNIEGLSANFIQADESIVQEGVFYLNKNRIKIVYLKPNKITIILDKDKAMYFNQDLEEVEYFNPEGSVAETFYDIFFNKEIFTNSTISEIDGGIILKKKLNTENKVLLIVSFEKNPINLRKIQMITEDTKIDLGIFNYNFEPLYKKNFFSMANPLI